MVGIHFTAHSSDKKLTVARKFKADGFTVVEMLLGIALFAILIPAVILALNSISTLNDSSKDLAISNIIAENKMEELRSIGFNSVPNGTTDITASMPLTLGANRSGSYTVTTPVAGQKQITINLVIQARGLSRTLNYRSVIGELGVGQ